MRDKASIALLSLAIPASAAAYMAQETFVWPSRGQNLPPILELAQSHMAVITGNQIIVTKDTCRMLTVHIPDSSVAYKPGVDVHGKPVVPANLESGANWQLPQTVSFQVREDLAAQGPREYEADFAEIKVNLGTNQITLNGQPLTSPDQTRLIAQCKSKT